MVNWKAHPYSADGYLFILKPQVVFRARVNLASATYPVAEVPYDGVTYGSISDVKMGMTVLFGSTEGSADRGRMYVRGDANHTVTAGAGVLRIGYCSRGHQPGEVNLIDDSYITVLDLYEPWKRASQMLGQNGGVLKDYDLTTIPGLPPIIHMGGIGGVAQMDFVNPSTNKHQVTDYDASSSHGADGSNPTITSVAWTAPGGSFINGTNSGTYTPDLEFSVGARWVSLTCFDSNGLRGLPRVQLVVSLANSGGIPGFSAPVARVSRARLSLKPEGSTLEADLLEALDPDDYVPGTVVIWMVKETYNGSRGSVTGYVTKFAGYLDYARSFGQGNEYDFERSTTIFAVDVAQRAAQLRGFPSTMARESSPNHANKMKVATLDRFWWWFLVWHTSIPMLTDCHWSGVSTDFRRFSSPGGSMYGISDGLAKAFGYRTTMDSRGRLLMVADPLRFDEADRTDEVMQEILPADIVRIERLWRSRGRVGQLRASFTRKSTIDASDPEAAEPDYSVTAPGDVEGQGAGSQQNEFPWWAETVTQAQARVGHDYERLNSFEDKLRIQLAHGGDAGIEPALMRWVEISTDDDTVGWNDAPLVSERCLVTAVEFVFDDEAGTMTQSIEVERETVGTPGRVDPIAGDDTPTPPPDGRYPDYTTDETPGSKVFIVAANTAAAHVTDEWTPTATTVTWTAITGLSGTPIWVAPDPFDWRGRYVYTTGGLYHCPNIWAASASFTLVDDNAGMLGDSARRATLIRMSINYRDYIAFACGTNTLVFSFDGGATWNVVAVDGGAASYSADGTMFTSSGLGRGSFAISPYNSADEGWIYYFVYTGGGNGHVYKSTDWGYTWSDVSGAISFNWNGVSPEVPYIRENGDPNINDASQEVVFSAGAGHSLNAGLIRKSINAGITWSTTEIVSGNTQYAPMTPYVGYALMPFTYDGAILMVGCGKTGAGSSQGVARIYDDYGATDTYLSGEIFANANHQVGVNGSPVNSKAMLMFSRNSGSLWNTIDDGVSTGLCAGPAGYTGIAWADWDISDRVPPA